jgi:tryptophan 2,3-dioxygenase
MQKKYISTAQLPLSNLRETGFLDPLHPEEISKIFTLQKQYISTPDKTDPPSRFLYRECVLRNCKSPGEIKAFAIEFALQIKAGEKPILPQTLLSELQSVTDHENEREFYFIHQMIEALAGQVFHTVISVIQTLQESVTLKSDLPLHSLNLELKEAAQRFDLINQIMSVFNDYIPPEKFTVYRSALGRASGAQSPLRFLDYLLLEQESDCENTCPEAFNQKLPSQLQNRFKSICKNEATRSRKLSESSTEFVKRFAKDLEEDYPQFLTTTSTSLASLRSQSPILAEGINELITQRAIFKLWHYDIVLTQLFDKEKGTGGTKFEPFLRKSFLKDYHQIR